MLRDIDNDNFIDNLVDTNPEYQLLVDVLRKKPY